VSKFRFQDRSVDLDQRAERFLKTVAWLGGYVSAEQAHELGIRSSVPRVHGQLKDLETLGFLSRVTTYPAVYQVTKSVTRLLGADLSARRRHSVETVRTRLLTVNFYLEAVHWPVEFVFDHQQKITELTQLGCGSSMLPQRAGKTYLWQDLVLRGPSGDLSVAMIDHYDRNAYRQLHGVLERFAASLACAAEDLKVVVVVPTDARQRLFNRLLHQPKIQTLLPDALKCPEAAVKVYRVRRAVPVIHSLIPTNRNLREFWTSRWLDRREPGNVSRHSSHAADNSSSRNDVRLQKGGESW
jgi:hypothetical protein